MGLLDGRIIIVLNDGVHIKRAMLDLGWIDAALHVMIGGEVTGAVSLD